MNTTRICVLGGTGFVGRHLAHRLIKGGHQIRILTRHTYRHRDLLVMPAVELCETDVYDPQALRKQFADCQVVINLIGILNESGHRGKGFIRAHVNLAQRVLDACRAEKVARLIHMSALGAETKAPSHYLRTKGEAEQLVHQQSGNDLGVTSFRPSVIFGTDDSFFNRFARLLKLTPYYFPLACPASKFAPIYVGDVAEAFVKAIDDDATIGNRYDLCGPDEYTLRQLVEYTAKTAGLRRRIIGLPPMLSKLQATVLEWVPGKPMSLDNYHSLQVPSVCQQNGLITLGITPTSVESVVPLYIGKRRSKSSYERFRRRRIGP